MKFVFRATLLLLTAAAGFGFGTYMLYLQTDRESGRHRTRELYRQLDAVLTKEKTLRDERDRLSQEATALSARTRAAETRYAEERATNDPLRQQLEKMTARQIANSNDLERHANDLKTTREALAAANERLGKLDAENQSLKGTIPNLETNLRDKTAALADLQTRLDAAQARETELRKTLAEAQAKFAKTAADLAAATARNTELAAELEALRKPAGK